MSRNGKGSEERYCHRGKELGVPTMCTMSATCKQALSGRQPEVSLPSTVAEEGKCPALLETSSGEDGA